MGSGVGGAERTCHGLAGVGPVEGAGHGRVEVLEECAELVLPIRDRREVAPPHDLSYHDKLVGAATPTTVAA